MQMKLTQKAVDRLRAPTASGEQELVADTELRGFYVRLSGVSTDKAYIVNRQVNGRTRKVTIGSTAEISCADARAEAADVIHQLRQGIDPKARKGGSLTLANALDKYLAKKQLRKSTATEYRFAIHRYLKKWLNTPMRDITREMVEKMHTDIAKSVAKRGRFTGHGVANSTFRYFRAIWNATVEDLPCPVKLKGQWYKLGRRQSYVMFDQLPTFYQAVTELTNETVRDFILVVALTGLRRRTAASITWDQIDLEAGWIRLPAQQMKSGRHFDLPITNELHDLLVRRRQYGGKFLFPGHGKSGHLEEPKTAFAEIKAKTGIAASSHDLKRTFATACRAVRLSQIELKSLLDHTVSDRDVSEGYVMLEPFEVAEAAQRVATKMAELMQKPKLPPEVSKLRA